MKWGDRDGVIRTSVTPRAHQQPLKWDPRGWESVDGEVY